MERLVSGDDFCPLLSPTVRTLVLPTVNAETELPDGAVVERAEAIRSRDFRAMVANSLFVRMMLCFNLFVEVDWMHRIW